jgi:hypothetical protein
MAMVAKVDAANIQIETSTSETDHEHQHKFLFLNGIIPFNNNFFYVLLYFNDFNMQQKLWVHSSSSSFLPSSISLTGPLALIVRKY